MEEASNKYFLPYKTHLPVRKDKQHPNSKIPKKLSTCIGLCTCVSNKFPFLHRCKGKYRLPDAIVAGARKCGTKFFTESLGLHPRIIKGTNKEYHFFDKHFYMGWEGYHQML